jgi:hypothetical protein
MNIGLQNTCLKRFGDRLGVQGGDVDVKTAAGAAGAGLEAGTWREPGVEVVA